MLLYNVTSFVIIQMISLKVDHVYLHIYMKASLGMYETMFSISSICDLFESYILLFDSHDLC